MKLCNNYLTDVNLMHLHCCMPQINFATKIAKMHFYLFTPTLYTHKQMMLSILLHLYSCIASSHILKVWKLYSTAQTQHHEHLGSWVEIWDFFPYNITLTEKYYRVYFNSALVRHSQTQKYLQKNPKPTTKMLWILFCLTNRPTDRQTNWPTVAFRQAYLHNG